MKKNKFNIQGMTCSSCQAHVQKAVENLNGIKNVNVNLLSNSMIVEYDEKTLNDKKIIEAVKNEGYGATLAINSQKDKIQNDNENTLNSMKKRLIISICFWIPLMYVAMYHMFYDLFGIPVPKLINDLLGCS